MCCLPRTERGIRIFAAVSGSALAIIVSAGQNRRFDPELSCNTPQMNEKELRVHFLAYNLIRMLMAQAATKAAVHPRTLSFKHTVQLWSEWSARGLCHRTSASIDLLFTLIGQLRVGNRPGRIEPRARKRRPKPYPWLKIPRPQARQLIEAYGHA
jgi:hypothetical protein